MRLVPVDARIRTAERAKPGFHLRGEPEREAALRSARVPADRAIEADSG